MVLFQFVVLLDKFNFLAIELGSAMVTFALCVDFSFVCPHVSESDEAARFVRNSIVF